MLLLSLNLKEGPCQTKTTESIVDIIEMIPFLVVFDVNYIHISMLACLPQKCTTVQHRQQFTQTYQDNAYWLEKASFIKAG